MHTFILIVFLNFKTLFPSYHKYTRTYMCLQVPIKIILPILEKNIYVNVGLSAKHALIVTCDKGICF